MWSLLSETELQFPYLTYENSMLMKTPQVKESISNRKREIWRRIFFLWVRWEEAGSFTNVSFEDEMVGSASPSDSGLSSDECDFTQAI